MINIIDANLVFTSALTTRTSTKYIVLHHIDAATATVEQIHQWHLNNGWAGIGYNLYIRKDGSIYKGRGVDKVGAHTQNYNSVSVGVALEGDYDKIDTSMPDAQYDSTIATIIYLKTLYPNAIIVGHKELGQTSCPGQYFPLDDLKAVKQRVVTPVVPEHWAEPVFQALLAKGVALDERRFDDNITRGEAFALILKVLQSLGK